MSFDQPEPTHTKEANFRHDATRPWKGRAPPGRVVIADTAPLNVVVQGLSHTLLHVVLEAAIMAQTSTGEVEIAHEGARGLL